VYKKIGTEATEICAFVLLMDYSAGAHILPMFSYVGPG
jgi:hypothetical protein